MTNRRGPTHRGCTSHWEIYPLPLSAIKSSLVIRVTRVKRGYAQRGVTPIPISAQPARRSTGT